MTLYHNISIKKKDDIKTLFTNKKEEKKSFLKSNPNTNQSGRIRKNSRKVVNLCRILNISQTKNRKMEKRKIKVK